jgi:hypothetical protein
MMLCPISVLLPSYIVHATKRMALIGNIKYLYLLVKSTIFNLFKAKKDPTVKKKTDSISRPGNWVHILDMYAKKRIGISHIFNCLTAIYMIGVNKEMTNKSRINHSGTFNGADELSWFPNQSV